VTPRKTWLIVSAALAVAVYALMWIGRLRVKLELADSY
jgi:hypothetical protein